MSRRLALPLALVVLASVSCGGSGTSSAKPVTITVGAAASLTAAFEDLGAAFAAANPDVTVEFSFGASGDVARQIGEGAPIDVFASADAKNMDKVVASSGVSAEPVVFATNSLQIIVGAGNPKAITGIDDLARRDVLVVACSPDVPIGKYTQQVLDAVGVTVKPVSLEENVKGIVSKVTLGEADAGVVYRTDVLAAGDAAVGVDIPANVNVTARYPIAALKSASAAARDFVAFVLSDAGQAVLQRFGFGAP